MKEGATMTTTVSSIPQAELLLYSLRSVGYSEEAAIADIVDNAITAEADEVHITFDWESRIVLILDNGQGMGTEEPYKNMQIGSSEPEASRTENDLGRFGLGMKTAAFSLGRKVTVVSLKDNKVSNAAWDLDKVGDIGWKLLVESDNTFDRFLEEIDCHGTAIIISNLDNLINGIDEQKAKRHFYSVIEKVKNHLCLVFHRFISEDGLKIYVNSNAPLVAWDPFVVDNPATQELSEDEVWDPEYKTCTRIQPYVLPHRTKFTSEKEYDNAAGVKGWNRHQGIYLYRNRRLIIYGTWFDLIRKEPAFNLARIRIDISAEADSDWKIDIKKSRASLPVYLRDRILLAVDDSTTRSTKVFNSRGAYSKRTPVSPNLDYVWEQTRVNGSYAFKINKKHILLNAIRKQLNENGREELKTYLALIENFAPFMKNGVVDTINTGDAKENAVQRQKDIADISNFVNVFKGQGFSKKEIKDTLLGMSIYSYIRDEIIKIVEDLDA